MKHTILFIAITILFLFSCKKEETVCELEANGAEIEMAIVQFNTTNAATGFETVFTGLESDSMKMAQIAQAFVNPVRFLKDRSGYFLLRTGMAGCWRTPSMLNGSGQTASTSRILPGNIMSGI